MLVKAAVLPSNSHTTSVWSKDSGVHAWSKRKWEADDEKGGEKEHRRELFKLWTCLKARDR